MNDVVLGIPEGTWVCANMDFKYGPILGQVKRGQIFQTGGFLNDGLLVKHQHLVQLEVQPKTDKAVQKMLDSLHPCGECGRVFAREAWRDKCGMSHQETAEDQLANLQDRRSRVAKNVAPGGRPFDKGFVAQPA